MAKHVIIAGAGPAGALLAYLMARRGIGVTLIERQTDFSREFRGEAMMPSGIDAIRQAGLGSQFDSVPHFDIRTIEIRKGQQILVSIPVANIEPSPRIVPQARMIEMIVEEASHFPGFTMVRGATIRDLIQENGCVAGVIADTHDGPREFRADFVIGADGRSSILRKRAALKEDRILQGFDVVWWHLPPGVIDHGTGRGYVGGRRLVILYSSPEGHLQMGWTIPKGAFADWRKADAARWYSELAPNLSDDLRDFLNANRDALAHPVLLDVICDRLLKWTAPGMLLIGDASHPMSPVGGQGINIALRDAIVAANHLVPVLSRDFSSPTQIDGAAQKVQTERWPEVVQIQNMQQTGPTLITSAIMSRIILNAPVVGLITRVFAPAIARQFDPFLHGAIKVALTV